jgi:hypothetical protein
VKEKPVQAFVNVATAPVRKTTQSGGKTYWEFRAAESAKLEEKAAATWYTVRVFQEADPGFSKGDFVRLLGKLKLDVFMSRDGKPMGVLVVMCYEAKRYDKQTTSATADGPKPSQETAASQVLGSSPVAHLLPAAELEDESWLALVS